MKRRRRRRRRCKSQLCAWPLICCLWENANELWIMFHLLSCFMVAIFLWPRASSSGPKSYFVVNLFRHLSFFRYISPCFGIKWNTMTNAGGHGSNCNFFFCNNTELRSAGSMLLLVNSSKLEQLCSSMQSAERGDGAFSYLPTQSVWKMLARGVCTLPRHCALPCTKHIHTELHPAAVIKKGLVVIMLLHPSFAAYH